MTALHTELSQDGLTRYKVFHDYDDSLDHDEEYKKFFLEQDLESFIVEVESKCDHCGGFVSKYSFCGIHARTSEEALEYYKKYLD